MVKIKITRGTYGFKQDGGGSIYPKTVKDPPFEVDEKEAERLIALGVAARVDDDEDTDDGDEDDGKSNPPYDKSMSLKDLQRIAGEYGVKNAEKLTTKDRVITAIEEVING